MQPQMNHPQMMQPQMNQQPLMGQIKPNLNQCTWSFIQKKSSLLGNIHLCLAGCVALTAWALGDKLLVVPPTVGVFACLSLQAFLDFGFLFVLIVAMILKSFVVDVLILRLLYLLVVVEFRLFIETYFHSIFIRYKYHTIYILIFFYNILTYLYKSF